jgi:GH15 family glucan-1,4-alpha-glucosidase
LSSVSASAALPFDGGAVPARIEEYALIGDCHTAALVSRAGSIDWLCWPRFDAPACFAALLGTQENGFWRIAPVGRDARPTRRYRDGTLVLETRFENEAGAATIVDFMPPRDGASNLVRLVRGERGSVDFETEIVFRFDYGRTVPWVSRADPTTLTAIAGPDLLVLRSDVELHGEDLRTRGTFRVGSGETRRFVLTHVPSIDPLPPDIDVGRALAETEGFWRDFSGRCPQVGRWTEQVRRSLITLKALTYAPTGGIVAAPTTSLPEWIGGERNWDYRFCWLRDATFTLLAFIHLGYLKEAEAWRDWLLRAAAGAPDQLQIMYGLAGERWLPECELPWLPGHEGSSPVRVGNAAAEQLQLDVIGEVIDALTQGVKGGLKTTPRGRHIGHAMLAHLARVWRQPDQGIWEIRGPARHFVHSKVMAWVAFDRAAAGAADGHSEADLRRWRALADEIHADICARGYDPELGSFVQSYGSKLLDASLLMLPLLGFLPHDDSRITGTVAAVEKRLLRHGVLLRYDSEAGDVDGLPPKEGAFLACSFWLADAYALAGRCADAERLFDRLLGYCNDVGLLSEEYDPQAGRMLGNFPQAFSHVGLIIAALNLARAQGPAQVRAEGASSLAGEAAPAHRKA